MGSLFKGAKSTQTTNSTQTTTAPDWQNTQLQKAFGAAGQNYDQAQAEGAYMGPMTAGMNETQKAALAQALGYSQGTGQQLTDQAGQAAGSFFGAVNPFLQTAGALAQGGTGAPNGTASGVLTAAANGQPMGSAGVAGSTGLQGQQGALSLAQQLAARGGQDGNAAIVAGANQYVDPTRVQGTVDAALRDVSRNLNENQLPGLNARAMAGGNVNSARAGAAEAVARRGAEDRAADIASQIRQGAWDTGVQASLATQGQQNALVLGGNQQAAGVAGALSNLGEGQRQFDSSTRLGAAQDLGALDLSARQLDANTRLGANAQLGSAAMGATGQAAQAGALADQNVSRMGSVGDAQQAEAQRQIDEARSMQNRESDFTWDQLRKYMGIVGTQMWGGTTNGQSTTTQQQAANPLGGILGMASLAASPFTGGASLGGTLMSGIRGIGSLFGGGAKTA